MGSFLAFGEILFDCFPDGRHVLGGAPLNVAYHMACLGLTSSIISAVGDDELGRQAMKEVKDAGVDTAEGGRAVDAIKQMVEDYNAIVKEVKEAYSTIPLQQTNGSKYEPLTDDDKADMSESEIEAYEEKAKTGLLFGDNDLSSLYNALRSAVAPGGNDGSFLRSIGINTSQRSIIFAWICFSTTLPVTIGAKRCVTMFEISHKPLLPSIMMSSFRLILTWP